MDALSIGDTSLAPDFVTGPEVWKRSGIRDASRWSVDLTAVELREFERDVTEVDVPKGVAGRGDEARIFSSTVDAIRAHLFDGPGFVVVRGLEVCDLTALQRMYCALGARLGEIVPQNADGDTLRRVTDAPQRATHRQNDAARRGHQGRAAMHPHNDSADVVGLLCVRQAKTGGATRVVSSMAVYNEILQTRPEFLGALCAGFHFDLAGKTKGGRTTSDCLPVFGNRQGRLLCTFNKVRIEVGMRKARLPLDDVQRAAIGYMNDLAMSDDFSVKFLLSPGEILFLNSHVTLHGRDEFEDWSAPERRRLLLRLWVNTSPPQKSLGGESMARY